MSRASQVQASYAWREGAQVEFDMRKGGTLRGVVTELPKTRGARIAVRTTDGKNMVVPPAMLRAAKLDDAAAKRAEDEGRAFAEKNDARRERYDAEMVARCQRHIDGEKLARGSSVKYQGRETRVLSVDREAGKVTIANPRAEIRDWAEYMKLDYLSDRVSRIKDSVTVWADRVHNTTSVRNPFGGWL